MTRYKDGRNPAVQRAFDERYEAHWRDLSRFTRALTNNRCCYPRCGARATSTHHVCYDEPAAPLVTIFPLCSKHHGTDPETKKQLPVEKMHPTAAHHPANWVKGTYGKLYKDAHNTNAYVNLLKFGAALLQQKISKAG